MPAEQALSEAAARHQRYNFVALTFDGLFFWFGYSYYSPVTILPLFVSHLTPSNVLVGAVPAVVAVCWSLPQLLGARAAGRVASRKSYIVRTALLGRVPLAAIVVCTAFFAASRPGLTLAVFFVGFGLYRLTGGLNTPVYYDLVAAAIHPRARARFIGFSQFVGGAIGAAALALGRAALDAMPFPGGFVFCFAVGLVFMIAGIGFMAIVREPPYPQRPPPAAGERFEILGAAARTLRRDAAFRAYLGGRLLVALGTMAAAFFAVHATRSLGATDGDVALYTTLLLAGQTVSTILWGTAADRSGLPPVLIAAAGISTIAPALALAAPSAAVFALVFVALGVAAGALAITDPGFPLALAERTGADRGLYVAVANTALAPFNMAAPLLGGVLADAGGYHVTFWVALALNAAACLALVRSRS